MNFNCNFFLNFIVLVLCFDDFLTTQFLSFSLDELIDVSVMKCFERKRG